MGSVDAFVFIDANQYLDLYRVTKAKKLLDALREQREYIFVTAQIVDEVQRSKLKVTADFLNGLFKELELRTFDLPDHIFDMSLPTAATLRQKVADIRLAIADVNSDLRNVTARMLEQISRSEDQISKALIDLFDSAITHTAEELQRARDRKERGNPPGKKADPLGDQLTWQQLLTHCKGKSKVWIISKDSDYGVRNQGKVLLNSLLCQDLGRLDKPLEVFCFDNIADGLTDFAQSTGVKAETLPTPEESKEIKEELDSLSPLDWMSSSATDANFRAIQNAWEQQKSKAVAVIAAIASQGKQGFLP